MESRLGEIIRIVVISLIGAVLMFLVQPWLYRSGIVPVDVPDIDEWIAGIYTPGATIVFTGSVISAGVWYVIASRAKIRGGSDVPQMAGLWWLLGLLPVLSICIALYFFRGTDDAPGTEAALLSLTGFYIFDVLLIFWLSTAISSPGSLKYGAVPGSYFIRHGLFGGR